MKILVGLLILPFLLGLRWAKKKIYDEFVGYPTKPLPPVK